MKVAQSEKWKNSMGFLFIKMWQILKYFFGISSWAQIIYFGVVVGNQKDTYNIYKYYSSVGQASRGQKDEHREQFTDTTWILLNERRKRNKFWYCRPPCLQSFIRRK